MRNDMLMAQTLFSGSHGRPLRGSGDQPSQITVWGMEWRWVEAGGRAAAEARPRPQGLSQDSEQREEDRNLGNV